MKKRKLKKGLTINTPKNEKRQDPKCRIIKREEEVNLFNLSPLFYPTATIHSGVLVLPRYGAVK